MLFNSITFLIFHFLFVGLYWASPSQRIRQVLLLSSSVIFYGWYYWPALILLAISMAANYGFSLWIDRSENRRLPLTVAIVSNLLSLSWFKYSKFIAENVVALLALAGADLEVPEMSRWLPLGISFYTFQIIAYLVDVSRNEVKAERNFLVFGVFKCFYGQLIAGPIVRANELIPQLKEKRPFSGNNFQLGIYFLISGLAIKICVADMLAQFVDFGFASPENLAPATAWATLYGFAFQILADFWGYSTVAMGIGLMFGIRLPLNFNMPYLSTSLRDFWRRWHITLSEWLRDYLYIPLGGNRKNQDRNLILTMLLGGLWHGASWNFAIWGLGHGLWLMIERKIPKFLPENRFINLLKLLFVFHGVALLWVFFRAPNFTDAIAYLEALFTASKSGERSPPDPLLFLLLSFTLYSAFLGKSLTDRRFLNWSLMRQLSICVISILLIIAFANANLDFIYFVF